MTSPSSLQVPLRIAVVSSSRLIRMGVVSLVASLREEAIITDAVATVGVLDARSARYAHSRHDISVHDLGLVEDPATALRALADRSGQRRATPVVGLVHDPASLVAGLPLMPLAVSADEMLALLNHVLDEFGDPALLDRRLPGALSTQEFRVIELIGSGWANDDIADELFVSVNTVKTYVRSAYRKVGVSSRPAAIMWALDHGLAGGRSGVDAPAASISTRARPPRQ